MKPEKLIEILLRLIIISCLCEQKCNSASELESIPLQEKEK